MLDFFLNLIEVNESVNYALIISVIVSYFLVIWFIVSIWVFFDARKRYPLLITSTLFALFTVLFGPPALIFYIMVRPEHTLEEDYYMSFALSGEKEARPIYFDGNRGFDISINLSLQPKESDKDKHKMRMNVEWAPWQGQSYKVTPKVTAQRVKEHEQKKGESLLQRYKRSARLLFKQLRDEVSQMTEAAQKSKQEKSEQREDQKAKQKKRKDKKHKGSEPKGKGAVDDGKQQKDQPTENKGENKKK